MNERKQIVIDTLGSDKGPSAIILGASMILNEHPDVDVILVGDEDLIKEEMAKLSMDANRVKIIDAKDTIRNTDNIMTAFYDKPNASILLALKELADNNNAIGLLSAGNTGAVLVGTIRFLRRDDGVRPCLAAIMPNAADTFTCLVDTGATIDCQPAQLHEFAKLGSAFMHDLYRIENPRVALLSNGAEPTKGNKLVKETHKILAADETLNFVGNVEGNSAFGGGADVVVADGFASNQLIKATEGAATRIITDIVKYSKMNNKPEIMPLVGYLMGKYDISNLGGGIILGARKLVIKCRGNSGEKAILNTSTMIINMVSNQSVYNEVK